MIPKLAAAGHRVIAVDLVGCGRSDKPRERADYTQDRHIDWLTKWMLALDLEEITLFCQDWGGTLGLHLVANHPERFARVIAANTGLPLGQGESEFMKMWVGMMRAAETFPFAQMLPSGMTHTLSPEEFAAYQAPFPDPSFEAAICTFPMLIAVQPDNPGVPANRDAWEKLGRFEKPFLTLFGAKDPVTQGGEQNLIDHIPGAAGQPHYVYPDASHFIQEDEPDDLVKRILAFIESTR
jgi:haloalkane dehalogenase